MDYVYQGLDLLSQIMIISGQHNSGLYVLRRLPGQLLHEFKSLDFMLYLTSKQGREFAKQLVSAQLADQICWTDQGSDAWVQKLGLRCPFVFSHSIILVEKLHSYVLSIRRLYEREQQQPLQVKQHAQELRTLARRCLIHVDISYTVWNLLHTGQTQYLETALHIILDALLLEKFRCIHSEGYKGARTFLTATLHSSEKRKQKLDLFNEWIAQMSLKFLKHPPLDAEGQVMDPTISLEVPFLPAQDTPLQNGQNPRLFQIIEILSTFYLLLKDAALSRQQNNPRRAPILNEFTLNELNLLRERLLHVSVERTPELPALHIHIFRLASLDLRLPHDALSLAQSPQVVEEVIAETTDLRSVRPERATFLAQFLASANEIEALCTYILAIAQQDQSIRGLHKYYQIPIERVILLEERHQIMQLGLAALDEKQTCSTNTYKALEGTATFLMLQRLVHVALVREHNLLAENNSSEKEDVAKHVEVLDRRPAQNLQELIHILQKFQMLDCIVELIISRINQKQELPISLELQVSAPHFQDMLIKDLEQAYSGFISKIYSDFPKNPAQILLPRLKELKQLTDPKNPKLFPERLILSTIQLQSVRVLSLTPHLSSEDIFQKLVRNTNPKHQFWFLQLFLSDGGTFLDAALELFQIYEEIENKENMKRNPKPMMSIMGKKFLLAFLMVGSIVTHEDGLKWKERVEVRVEKIVNEVEEGEIKSLLSARAVQEMEYNAKKLLDDLDLMNQRLDRANGELLG